MAEVAIESPEQLQAIQAALSEPETPSTPAIPTAPIESSPSATIPGGGGYPSPSDMPKSEGGNLGNVFNAIGSGVNNAATELGGIINNPAPLANSISGALQTNSEKSLQDYREHPYLSSLGFGAHDPVIGLGAGALQGTAQLANGVLGIPSALQNAWEGKHVSDPSVQIPTGGLEGYISKEAPVTGAIGGLAPYLAIDAATAGGAAPSLLQGLKSGAGYGLLGTPGDLQERSKAAVNNAALGAAIHAGGKVLGKVTGAEGESSGIPTTDTGGNTGEASTPPVSYERSSDTGHLQIAQPSNPTEANPLKAGVSNQDQGAPWDNIPEKVLSPETGQAASQENLPSELMAGARTQLENESASNSQPQAVNDAIQQMQARRAVANQNQESFGTSPQQLNDLQAQIQNRRAVANQNQESFSPNPQAVDNAQSAMQQVQARQQALAQEAQNKAITQKADEIHGRLVNYERLGAKPQAAKLKAEIAEQAAMHPDPVHRAAYQQALERYAPVGQEIKTPKVETKKPETKVNLEAKATKTQVEPKAVKEKPVPPAQVTGSPTKELQGSVKFEPPHVETDAKKTNDMIKSGLDFPDLVGVEMPDGKVQLITGSHRYAALEKAGEPVEKHVYVMKQEDMPKKDWKEFQGKVSETKDYDGLVDEVHKETNNPELKELLKGQTKRTDRAEDGSLIKSEMPETELKAKTEKTQPETKKKEPNEALDAIYPEKPYPKEPIFESKPQGTDAREHFLEAQVHKEGKFHKPEQLESDARFRGIYDKLSTHEQERLQSISDAITDKKKIITNFYNPGTETESGVLSKRSGHGQELYTPKGLSVTKKGEILIHGYNENSELSSRRLDRFSGHVEKTTEAGYEGLYRHPEDLNEAESFHPSDAIVEQVSNPIQKKQIQGKPILESDYKKAAATLKTLLKELPEQHQAPEDIEGILNRLPEPVKEYLRGNPCG